MRDWGQTPLAPLLGAVVASMVAASPLASQTFVVRVEVTDSTRHAIAGAAISVVRRLGAPIAEGTTDANGRLTLSLPFDSGYYELVARRIGYARTSMFVPAGATDSVPVWFQLTRLTQQLPVVRVTADQSAKRQHLSIDADEIASNGVRLDDATDILKKLRPYMITGVATYCGPVRELWVNGKRIFREFVPVDEAAMKRARSSILQQVRPHILSALATIRLEHIAEMNYRDCADQSTGKLGSQNALYVVLKPGIGFDPKRGSYVADATTGAAAYRARVLGVFDEENGNPLAGCDVIHVASGTRARTTETGTVSLLFVPEGTSSLRVEKAGYRPLTVSVTIAPGDTTPITLIIGRK